MSGSSVASSFIAQQYSSATILLRFPANKKKLVPFQNIMFSFF